MVKIRTEKTADERYPATMLRLRRLHRRTSTTGRSKTQIRTFLERVDAVVARRRASTSIAIA